MASLHVAGLAALVISRYGNSKTPQNGKMRPEQVKALIDQTADPQPCPTAAEVAMYGFFPQTSGAPQSCQGGTGYNSWYGKGIINALNAVTHTRPAVSDRSRLGDQDGSRRFARRDPSHHAAFLRDQN